MGFDLTLEICLICFRTIEEDIGGVDTSNEHIRSLQGVVMDMVKVS